MLVVVGTWIHVGVASAQVPQVPKGVSGYTVTVQHEWLASNSGFFPVRVAIKTNPVAKVVEDRVFTVSAVRRAYRTSQSINSTTLVIPAGSSGSSTELYVDATGVGNYIRGIELIVEEGQYDGRRNNNDVLRMDLSSMGHHQRDPAVLFVSSQFSQTAERSFVCYLRQQRDSGSKPLRFVTTGAVPRIDLWSRIYPDQMGATVTGTTTGAPTPFVSPENVIATNHRMHGIHPSRFPKSWIGLSSVDQILISKLDFTNLCRQQPDARSELEKWTAAGGALMIYDTGSRLQFADRVLPFLAGRNQNGGVGRQLEWLMADRETQTLNQLIYRQDRPNRDYYYAQDSDDWVKQDEIFEKDGKAYRVNQWARFSPDVGSNLGDRQSGNPSELPKFLISRYVNGQIVLIGDDLSQWSEQDWRALHNSVTLVNGDMVSRLGASTGIEEMPGFAIPGVGEPPIAMFQVLIGLFLFLAGPVMLIVLRRAGQMQYLFVAVPILSLIICVSLFLYVVIVDGSHRWGRTQTVTTIDHRTNMAVVHSRTNYYSGIHPGKYELPAGTMSFAALPESSVPQLYHFESGQQQISGGHIRSRTPHEIVSVRSQLASQQLVIVPPPESPAGVPPSIENQMGGEVELVVFRYKGEWFLVKSVADGKTKQATKTNLPSANAIASAIAEQLSPVVDQGYSSRRRSRFWAQGRFGQDANVVGTVRNHELKKLMEDSNSYIAFLKTFPLAEEQIEPVEYKLQLHIVQGRW